MIPDEATFRRLQNLVRWQQFRRGATRTPTVQDAYLDTADHRLFRRGFFARIRERGEGLLLTLKEFATPAEGAIHARPEYEATIPDREPAHWPKGPARRRIQKL